MTHSEIGQCVLRLQGKLDDCSWTNATDEAESKALELCKGAYQSDIVIGRESLSGSTLTLKQRRFMKDYSRSRVKLLARLADNGVCVDERTGPHNKRILLLW